MTDEHTPADISPNPADGYASDEVIRDLLHEGQTWIVVGLSDNHMRAAYSVAAFIQRHGKRIIPVHPRAQEVLGEPGYATLAEAAAALTAEDTDLGPVVVDMFVNSTRVGEVVREAIDLHLANVLPIKGVWLQLEVIDEEAAAEAVAAGLDVVMDRCPAIEWPRLGPAA